MNAPQKIAPAPAGVSDPRGSFTIRWVLAHEPVSVFERPPSGWERFLIRKRGAV